MVLGITSVYGTQVTVTHSRLQLRCTIQAIEHQQKSAHFVLSPMGIMTPGAITWLLDLNVEIQFIFYSIYFVIFLSLLKVLQLDVIQLPSKMELIGFVLIFSIGSSCYEQQKRTYLSVFLYLPEHSNFEARGQITALILEIQKENEDEEKGMIS